MSSSSSVEYIGSEHVLTSVTSEIYPLGLLLQGVDALIMVFVPYIFGDLIENTMEYLINDLNLDLPLFENRDVRVICVTRCCRLIYSDDVCCTLL